jgi:hypothetical protein
VSKQAFGDLLQGFHENIHTTLLSFHVKSTGPDFTGLHIPHVKATRRNSTHVRRQDSFRARAATEFA